MASRRDRYSMLKDEGKLHGTLARARQLRKERDSRHISEWCQSLLTPKCRILIPLGGVHANTIRRQAIRERPRLQRWLSPKPNADIRCKQSTIITIHRGRYSSRCTFVKVGYEPRVRSFAIISPKRMCWFIGSNHGLWVAPRGWHFGEDTRPGDIASRVYVCKNSTPNDLDFRWYFNTDDVYMGVRMFWRRARQFVQRVQRERRDKKEYARITSTVITVDLIVPHNGVQTVLRIQRTGPMSYYMGQANDMRNMRR